MNDDHLCINGKTMQITTIPTCCGSKNNIKAEEHRLEKKIIKIDKIAW